MFPKEKDVRVCRAMEIHVIIILSEGNGDLGDVGYQLIEVSDCEFLLLVKELTVLKNYNIRDNGDS